MSTTAIDYDQLNDAAKLLFDTARSKGFTEGEEKGRHQSAEWQMRGNMDLAEKMLRRAVALPSSDLGDAAAQDLVIFARMLLSRTPLMHSTVQRALDKIKRNSIRAYEPSRVEIEDAADILRTGLGALGGYL